MEDWEAWIKYPQHRNWFNKLWVADRLKYRCGPAGLPPSETLTTIVRPIYNLNGMGVGAEIKILEQGDMRSVPPGFCWVEKFEGRHISATYEFHSSNTAIWKPLSVWQGFRRDGAPLYKFDRWERLSLDQAPVIPRELNELFDVKVINVEFIGNKVIEVHLRESPDPEYDIIIPIWDGEDVDTDLFKEYEYINDPDDGEGQLPQKRLGFFVKNR